MRNYPLEKYQYYFATKVNGEPYKVVAVSTYAGRRVRGVAKCSPEDEFDIEKGKILAAARCSLKVSEKRRDRAVREFMKAKKAVAEANKRYRDMEVYMNDAFNAVAADIEYLKTLTEKY